MLVLSYSNETYEALLQKMASFFGVTAAENKFYFPEISGNGFFELVNLPMGIQALLSDFSIKDDYCYIRQKSDTEYYNLRLEVIREREQSQILINNEIIESMPGQAYIFMTSSKYTLTYKVKKGMIAKSLNLRLSRNNIKDITGTDTDKLLSYCVTNDIHHDKIIPAHPKMLELLTEMLAIPENDPYRQLKIFSRSLLITELFFECINLPQYQSPENKVTLTNHDFDRIREIENIITGRLNQLPPKQEELASLANMSLSKLKYTFKAIHGTSIYNYYQKVRMEKALQLLQEGHTISETAQKLGFKDLTNFTRNFKRNFNIQPAKVRQLINNN